LCTLYAFSDFGGWGPMNVINYINIRPAPCPCPLLPPSAPSPLLSALCSLHPHPSTLNPAPFALHPRHYPQAELKQAFIVSEVVVVHTQEELMAVCVTTAGLEGEAAEGVCAGGVTVGVARAAGTKCVRCWGYTTDAGADDRHPELCARCTPIVIAAVGPELDTLYSIL